MGVRAPSDGCDGSSQARETSPLEVLERAEDHDAGVSSGAR